jgi:MscS family membrane protein
MTDAIIENPGRMQERRFFQTIGLRYEDFNKVKSIVSEITHYLKHHKEIDPSKVLVHFINFGSYSLDIEVIAYTHKTSTDQFRPLQEELLFKIGEIILNGGAEMPYPTSVVLKSSIEGHL